MNLEIVRAAKERRLVNLIYDAKQRTVEIHTYGRTTTGHDTILCWQIEPLDVKNGWRLFHVEKITGMKISQSVWQHGIIRSPYAREVFQIKYATQ